MPDKKQSFAAGAVHDGPRAFLNETDPAVDVAGFYALTDDGKELLLRGGNPVRLTQVDLAPDDPDDGSEEYRIARDDDPAQVSGNIVDLEVDEITSKTGVGA